MSWITLPLAFNNVPINTAPKKLATKRQVHALIRSCPSTRAAGSRAPSRILWVATHVYLHGSPPPVGCLQSNRQRSFFVMRARAEKTTRTGCSQVTRAMRCRLCNMPCAHTEIRRAAGAVCDQSCPKQEWMPRLVSASPRLSKAGMPSRSEAGAVCSKSRSVLSDIREAHRLIRSASRPSIRCALRAIFEQTAPPSLREGTPPNLGGDWSTRLQPNQVYIASTTFKPLQGATLRLPVHPVLDTYGHRPRRFALKQRNTRGHRLLLQKYLSGSHAGARSVNMLYCSRRILTPRPNPLRPPPDRMNMLVSSIGRLATLRQNRSQFVILNQKLFDIGEVECRYLAADILR